MIYFVDYGSFKLVLIEIYCNFKGELAQLATLDFSIYDGSFFLLFARNRL